MDALCGSKFWDANLSVYSDDPDLTPCFQNSLLAWVPCIYLGATLPCYLFHLRHHHRGYVILSHLSRLKTALGVLLWCISGADLFYAFHGLVHGWAPAPVVFVTPLLVGVTVRLATPLIQHERLQGVQSPGVLIIFWFPCVVCAIVPFRSKILSAVAKGKTSDPFRFATFYIYFALVLFALILSCSREQPPFFSPKNVDPDGHPWLPAPPGGAGPLVPDRGGLLAGGVDRLTEAWKKQQKQAARHRAAVASGKSVSGEDVVLLGGRPRPREPSFPRAVLATCGSGIFTSICFKLTQDLLSFVNPQLLSILIRFISNPVAPPRWGFPVAGLMFARSVMQTLLSQQYLHCIYVMVLRLRSAITGVIYRKNLGPSILAGVALIVLLVPLNGAVAMKMRALQQMKFKDSRTKLTSEILGGFKVLKLYAWEPVFLGKVEGIREDKLQILRQSAYLQAISTFTWVCTPFLVTLITLGVYVSVDQNNVPDAEKAFVSVSLFNILKTPPEPAAPDNQRPGPDQFSDIQVPKGALVAVVGPVGCGKSSLVSALLGEMENLEGTVCVKGSVAYVPQQAWIQNCTLQEDILFGRALDPKRYQQALEACALLADLEMLPAGDQTETGEKRQRTRVLVTHSINFLPQMDFIIVLADGQVSEVGPYPALLQHSGSFANFLCNYAPDKPEKNLKEGSRTALEDTDEEEVLLIEDTLSNHTGLTDNEPVMYEVQRQFMSVKLSVFWDYAKGMGLYTIVAICLLYLGHSAAAIGASVWLSAWSDEAMVDGRRNNTYVRLGVYAALSVLQGLLVMVSAITLMVGSVQAARSLHRVLLHNRMRSPQSSFHTTPSGRILNWFSKDIYVIDEVLAPTILMPLNSFHNSISAFVVTTASTPLFTVVTLPLAVLYITLQRFYVATSRHLKRLDSVSRSPIYSHFSETVTGTSVIRAYGRSQDFKAISDAKVDTNMRRSYPYVASNRWLWVHVESVGNCVVFFAALFAVIGGNSPSPGLVGLSVSDALQITISLTWMIQMMSDLESNIVAVERVKEYSKIETEEFWNFSVRYRPGLELVLRNLSLRMHGGEKVGIVGCTGAGKSSMTLCPFRILEAAEGEIRIDGLNVADMGLHDLRPQLTVIPQDPILFSASLRMNLDPFGYYSEADLWRALELSHLHTFVGSQPEGLDFQCSEGGENLSRQLVCLARAGLRRSHILVLDKATAAMDLETDDLIRATVRTQFENCTVLTIPHWLDTIIDYTRRGSIHQQQPDMQPKSQIPVSGLRAAQFPAVVLVLDRGTVAEFDSPANLIAARGIFYGMARDAGLV
ncbi:ATP-binding cassette sub-family C member 3 [Prionailurus iriomotensis]